MCVNLSIQSVAINTLCTDRGISYTHPVAKLWSQTIDSHRRQVQTAVLDTTAALIADNGLRAVTMSQIAERTGISRATLYKYFPDVDAILGAWHERHVAAHLNHLVAIGDQTADPGERIRAVLQAYALSRYEMSLDKHGAHLVADLHHGQHVAGAQRALEQHLRNLLIDGVASGDIRDDIAPQELAGYCMSALAASSNLSSKAAVRRLVTITLDGLRPIVEAITAPPR